MPKYTAIIIWQMSTSGGDHTAEVSEQKYDRLDVHTGDTGKAARCKSNRLAAQP